MQPAVARAGDGSIGGPFRILVVCTGNVCRSPLAAAVLRTSLALGDDALVSSAGTHAVQGAPLDAAVAREARERGIDVGAHRARELQPADAGGDLLVALERAHRAWIAERHPHAARRTFTLLELDAVLADLERRPTTPRGPLARRLREVVDDASRARGVVISASPRPLDVPDPRGASRAVHHAVADAIEDAAGRVGHRLRVLAGVP